MDAVTGRTGASREAYDNGLLNALRATDYDALVPSLAEWHTNQGDTLFEPGDRIERAFFPCGPSLVSYLIEVEDGRLIETALVGREGAIGGLVSHGHLRAYARAEVRTPGRVLTIEIDRLEQLKSTSVAFANLFARYADCLLAEIYQTIACNAAHTIEQRTAKWLIAAMERTGTSHIDLTQGQLSSMIGVTRSYISRVLQRLKLDAVLDTRRGSLVVTNRRQLERLACGCHRVLRRHRRAVLAEIY
jgi:CRP-like cAMP-binding protein